MTSNRIASDVARYRAITEGRIRTDLGRVVKNGGFSIDTRNGKVTVPLPIIEIPRFQYGERSTGGVGVGEGNKGDPLSGNGSTGSKPEHGEGNGTHDQVEFDRKQFAEFLIDHFGLPNMRDVDLRGEAISSGLTYDSVAPLGVIRHPKRTITAALKRNLASGTYVPGNPIDIRKSDTVYRYPRPLPEPSQNAVIGYLLDISGSTSEVIPFLKLAAHATDCLLSLHYPNVDRFYVHYDSAAKEVPSDQFYLFGAGGGTNMHAGYRKVVDIVNDRYPPSSYNLYLIHLTDGDSTGLDTSVSKIRKINEGRRNSMRSGHILTDEVLSAFNCVYVLEAGAYYGDNFSKFIQRLATFDKELAKRLRVATFSEGLAKSDPVDCLRNALGKFFA